MFVQDGTSPIDRCMISLARIHEAEVSGEISRAIMPLHSAFSFRLVVPASGAGESEPSRMESGMIYATL